MRIEPFQAARKCHTKDISNKSDWITSDWIEMVIWIEEILFAIAKKDRCII